MRVETSITLSENVAGSSAPDPCQTYCHGRRFYFECGLMLSLRSFPFLCFANQVLMKQRGVGGTDGDWSRRGGVGARPTP